MATRRDARGRGPGAGPGGRGPALSSEEQTARARGVRVRQADDRTDHLLSSGVRVNGVLMSAEPDAQQRWNMLFNARTALTYPVVLTGVDPDTNIIIQDPARLATAYNAYAVAVLDILREAERLKNNIKKATTIEEVSAISDSRAPKR